MLLMVVRKISESTSQCRNTASELLVAYKQAAESASVYPPLYRLSLSRTRVFVTIANNDVIISPHLSYKI